MSAEKRVVRIGGKTTEEEEHKVKISPSVEKILARKEFKPLKEDELSVLIDEAGRLDELQKTAEKKLKEIKAVLLQHAQTAQVPKASGSVFNLSAGSTTTTEVCTPTELAKFLKKEGKMDLFDAIVSIKIGELKKYFGEAVLEKAKILWKNTTPFSRLSLKRK